MSKAGVGWFMASVLASGWFGSVARAEVHVVRPDGTGDYPTIQAAIDAAEDGDTVELDSGVFSGTGNRNIEFRGKAITLRSASGVPETCVIDCGGVTRGVMFLENEGRGSRIEGITITNGFASFSGAGILCLDQASPEIVRCHVESCVAEATAGAIDCDFGSPLIEGCRLAGNEASWGGATRAYGPAEIRDTVILGNYVSFYESDLGGLGGGVYSESPDLILDGCTLAGNSAEYRGGALYLAQGSASMRSTVVWENCAAQGADVYAGAGQTAQFECSAVDTAGVAGPGSVVFIGHNLFVPPLYCDPAPCRDAPTTAGDYRLAENSPALADPVCGLIGAFGQGCGVISIDPMTWGRTKAMFRE